MSTYQAESFLGSGRLLVGLNDGDGVFQGYLDVGNAKSFAIKGISTEKKEVIGMRPENFGAVIDSVVTKKSQTLGFVLTDINRKNLALAMMGSDADFTQNAGNNTATPQELDVPVLDNWYQMELSAGVPVYNLDPETPPVVTTNATPPVTLDEWDAENETGDYEIDYVHGLIKPLSTGNISAADTILIGATALAITEGFQVIGDSLVELNGKLLLLGEDQNLGRKVRLEIFSANLTPEGDQAWISTEYTELSFSGNIKYDAVAEGTYQYTDLGPLTAAGQG